VGTSFLPNAEQWDWIAESNRGGEVTLSVRGLDAAGQIYSSAQISLYFNATEVSGAIYYWSTGTEGVMRAEVSDGTPSLFYPAPGSAESGTCVGCHALSRDGTRLAVGYGGTVLREVSVPDRALILPQPQAVERASAWTAFSPDGELLLVAADGVLTLLDSDTGEPVGPNEGRVPLPETNVVTQPDWSFGGDQVAVVLGTRDGNKNVKGGAIALVPYNQGSWGEPEVVVAPVDSDDNNFFPAFSPDGKLIAYVTAQGDSKDATTAVLRLLRIADRTSIDLVRLNGRVNNVDGVIDIGNSMPSWAPSTRSGVLWLAFSSLREYASLRLRDPKADQIWIAAIDPSLADPSYAAFWAPFQDMGAGNHRAFWTRAANGP
jgi:TolB protein